MCIDAIAPLPQARCSLCLQPFFGVSSHAHLCPRCLRLVPSFSAVYCGGLYDGSLKTAIQQFKFNGRVNLDRSLAVLMKDALPAGMVYDLIVPVPLHRSGERVRTYNQSELLARELGRTLKIPVHSRLLVKQRKTPPQHNLSAAVREQNLRTAFSVKYPPGPQHILLVDDVLTTGATVASCSEVLLAAGAAAVTVVTIARTA